MLKHHRDLLTNFIIIPSSSDFSRPQQVWFYRGGEGEGGTPSLSPMLILELVNVDYGVGQK